MGNVYDAGSYRQVIPLRYARTVKDVIVDGYHTSDIHLEGEEEVVMIEAMSFGVRVGTRDDYVVLIPWSNIVYTVELN